MCCFFFFFFFSLFYFKVHLWHFRVFKCFRVCMTRLVFLTFIVVLSAKGRISKCLVFIVLSLRREPSFARLVEDCRFGWRKSFLFVSFSFSCFEQPNVGPSSVSDQSKWLYVFTFLFFFSVVWTGTCCQRRHFEDSTPFSV